ncbi:MAG: hypothetical protein ACLU3I_20650 [Acutalibacteraceae bacterium]
MTLQIPITKVVDAGRQYRAEADDVSASNAIRPAIQSYGRYEAGGTGLWDVQNCTVSCERSRNIQLA